MARKRNRLREFEKNHRVLDISTAQEERQKRRSEREQIATGEEQMAQETALSEELPAKGKSSTRKKRVGWARLIALGLVLVFVLVVGASVKNILDLKAREQSLADRHEELQQILEEMTITLENVNSDTYIEAQARRELKLVKGNELLFFFPEHLKLGKDKTPAADETGDDAAPDSEEQPAAEGDKAGGDE